MLSNQAEAVCDIIDFEEEDFSYERLVRLGNKKNSVKCRCPRCDKIHYLSFFWTGRGMPRKYCHRCRDVVVHINSQGVYETSPDAYRVNRGKGNTAD